LDTNKAIVVAVREPPRPYGLIFLGSSYQLRNYYHHINYAVEPLDFCIDFYYWDAEIDFVYHI
jgi:hypothetical protein